jgi:hypothetical protein
MKITFGMIIFESDFVLQECLEQVYPFAHSIVISEGPVSYWQKKGRLTSTDKTNHILHNFYDPDNKLKIIHDQFNEKDDQCRAYINQIPPDTEYLWNLDADEIYKTQDLKNIIEYLYCEKPTSVGIRSCTFYGGFDYYLTGFELNIDNFLRIFKYQHGCTWLTHRPPTIQYRSNMLKKHINSNKLYNDINFQMYHYSYVFPRQVERKISYYKECVSKQNCIDNYFKLIYLSWVNGDEDIKKFIENQYDGVHEFYPSIRGPCYTAKFNESHPESIQKNIHILKEQIQNQLKEYDNK